MHLWFINPHAGFVVPRFYFLQLSKTHFNHLENEVIDSTEGLFSEELKRTKREATVEILGQKALTLTFHTCDMVFRPIGIFKGKRKS
jgi:hypothetical protein